MMLVALPWYHREDWPALHGEFSDRAAISPCYDSWKASAIARESKWRADGYSVYRIELRPEPFRLWCRAQKRDAGYASRRAYAEEMLMNLRPDAAAQVA